MSRSFAHWFVAPVDAPRREVRGAGARSLVIGSLATSAALLLAMFDDRWTGGAILRTRARLLIVVVAIAGYLLAAQGLFRLLTGVARGADEVEARAGARVMRIVFTLLAGAGLLATLVASFVVITPHEPAGPRTRSGGLDLAVPPDGVNEVRYQLGDATVTITRVQRDAALPSDAARPPP